jgi:hypothetical protein
LAQLKDDLSALQKNLFDDGLISKTLTDTALFQANLANLQAEVEGAPASLRKPVTLPAFLPSRVT